MCSRVHLVVRVPYKIWNIAGHDLSESLHTSPPITALLFLSPAGNKWADNYSLG